MPVSSTSRHAGLIPYKAPDVSGKGHPSLPLPLPPTSTAAGGTQHIVTGTETLEFLAWRYFGVSEFWWRIADVNPPIFPLDITAGTAVNIPRGSDFGRFLRERSFGG